MSLTKAPIPHTQDSFLVWHQSPYSLLAESDSQNFGVIGGNTAWPSANLIFYIPFWVPKPETVYKMGVFTGTSVSGNIDLGVYKGSTRLAAAGSTASAGTNQVQILDIADVLLLPGNLYYMAMWCDNTTAPFQRKAPIAPGQAAIGVMEEAGGAGALPATATMTFSQTRSYIPSIGVALRSWV